MSTLVRGIMWRKGQTWTLFLLGTVVVAGSLVVEQFCGLTDTPVGSVGVLLLLGIVALSVQAAGTARARRPEIALAQIRGRHGFALLIYLLAEPLTVLIVAAGSGALIGRTVTSFAADRWLPPGVPDPGRIGGLGWLTVGVAVAVSGCAVAAGSWRTIREPLIQQLDTSYRPRPGTTLVLFGQTMIIVAAAISAFQATQLAGSRGGWAGLGNPALLSPVLLGLAAAEVAAVAIRAGAALSSRRAGAGGGSLAGFLARRRMARRSNSVFGTRLVIAAAVVTAVTSSTSTAVADWLAESTKLAVGGPLQYTVAAGPLAAYDATHRIDPEGRWLMAMVEAPDKSEPYRRVFADTARWNAVVGGFLSDTGAGQVSPQLSRLQLGQPVQPATGSKVSITFTNASLRNVNKSVVTVFYATPGGSVDQAFVRPPRQPLLDPAGVTTVSSSLSGCGSGCTVTQLLVEGSLRGAGHPPYLVITGANFGGQELLQQTTWEAPAGGGSPRGTVQQGSVLRVKISRFGGLTNLKAAETSQRLAVLTTPGLAVARDKGSPIGYASDGSEHGVVLAGQVEALPFVGSQGMLMDLPRAMAGGSTVIPTATTYILARADTPGSVLRELQGSGVVGAPRDYVTTLDAAARRADVQGVRLHTLLSLFAMAIGLVGLAAAVTGQRDERRREAASLRLSGVTAEHIAAAYRVEAGWLAISTFVVVAATGWLATRVAVPGLALVPQTPYSPALHGEPRPVSLLVVAAGAGLMVGVVTYLVNRGVARRSPPSMLRDEVR
ncbi:MAG: FtsX-like permease family protein [Nocardioidaceae bacterium]